MIKNNAILEKDLASIVHHSLPWASLEGKTVLFVGINSFLLAYMVKTLLFLNKTVFKNPVKIKGIYRDPVRLKEQYGEDLKDISHYNTKDIKHSFIKEIGHSDIIIHGASPASPQDFMHSPLNVIDLNIFLTRHLLDYAKFYTSEKFVYFSSSEVYGPSETPLKEDCLCKGNPLNLRHCYGESKRTGEMLCSVYFHSYQTPIKVIRPFHTYGFGMRLRDGRIFSDLVADILEKKPLALKTDGKDIRSFCYLADAVVGYFTVLLKGQENEAYNVGNPDALCSMYELANMLQQLFPTSDLKVETKRSEQSICIPNIEKIKSLGWAPTIGLKEGFLRTVKSYEYT